MSDINAGAAPAAADTSSVASGAIIEQVADAPNPISTHVEQAPKPPAEEPKKPVSTREALERAAAKVKEQNKPAEAKAEPKPVETKQVQQPKGQAAPASDKQQPQAGTEPKPQDQQQAAAPTSSKFTAPDRFSNDAKTAWETAPEPVKAEVHRAIRELEQGHQKYKADAEAYAEIRGYSDLAKQHGTSVKDALDRYTGLERRLASADPNIKNQAIAEVLQYAGVSPQAYAAYVAGQPVGQAQEQQDAAMNALRNEIAGLKQLVGGVTNTMQDQRNSALMDDIAKFAAEKPRFDELAESIAKLISTGMAADLNEAYSMAERLNPAASTTPTPVIPAQTPEDLQAQTLKGSKSVAGAPSAGSDPGKKGKPSSSIRQALERAAAQAG